MYFFKLFVLCLGLSIFSSHAIAQKDGQPTNALVPAENLENKSDAPAGTKDQDYVSQPLDQNLCGYLTMNHTSYGNAILKAEKEQGIVPADVNSPHVKPPEVLTFPIMLRNSRVWTFRVEWS